MSRESERIFNEFHKFIADKELNEEELEKAFNEFIDMKNNAVEMTDFSKEDQKEDSWDYLDMAYEADNEDDALKYAKKALKLDKNCLDAEVLIADLTIDDSEELKKKYERLIKKGEKHLKEQDFFDEEDIGHFWGLVETRPYMRLRGAYFKLLIEMGKYRKAINEGEDLLNLSENDNLGIRYHLISMYALFEDEFNVLRLYKKYKEDSTRMLLPIIAMYYKMDNYKKAMTYLKKLNTANSELADFFCNMDKLDQDEIENIAESGVYRPLSKEEIVVTITDAPYLYAIGITFFLWIAQKLSMMNG